MKYILIVLDGMGDRPVKELGNKTPLEAAKTPAMDKLAKNGSNGMLDVLGKIAPESDSAVLTILGYDPYKYYTGRGPLEAVGTGVEFKDGMLAARCNFATCTENLKLVDRRVARSLTTKEAELLGKEINSKVKLKNAKIVFKPSVAHRAVLIIKSKKKLSSKITNTDPAYKLTKAGVPEALSKYPMLVKICTPIIPGASESAKLINDFTQQAYKVLNNSPVNKKREKKNLLPANTILCRDVGDKVPKLFSISKRYRKKWAILADMPLEIGIGNLSDMGIVRLSNPSFTKKDFPSRLKKTLTSLKKYDCLYIHIKGPDLFGHDGDFQGKKKSFEEIDKHFLQPLLKKISLKNTIIAITSDHATPCELKGHANDNVPFLVSGGKVGQDLVESFGEISCKKGVHGTVKGTKFMPLLMSAAK